MLVILVKAIPSTDSVSHYVMAMKSGNDEMIKENHKKVK